MNAAKPSRTALRVALRRAAHQVVDAPPLVFPDPFAVRILGPEAAAELARTPGAARRPHSAALRAWIVARARYSEEVLAEKAASGERAETSQKTQWQYLILGAGLDTFALRNPYSNVRVFEVDHPATQAWKRECLQAAGLTLPPTAHWVPVDFERHDLRDRLRTAGFDLTAPTVTAWLGVVPYLTPLAFTATARILGTFAPGSPIVFDYSQPRSALPPTEQLMHDSLAARVAGAGEPFLLFFTPASLAAALRPCGLTVVADLGSRELNGRFFATRTDGLALRGSAGRLCHAAVGEAEG